MDLIGKEVFATIEVWEPESEGFIYGHHKGKPIEGIFVGFGIKAVSKYANNKICYVSETAAIVFEPTTGHTHLVEFSNVGFKTEA